MTIQELIQIRHELHREPELSGEEYQTSQKIKSILVSLGADHIIEGIGETGIAAIFEGVQEGPSILFRAELDALPIQEKNLDLPYKSSKNEVSHKCGHDGHMAILIGLAAKIAAKRPSRGKIIVLFQPAEEDGSGAQAVIDDDKFNEIIPDYAFALHNLPGYPLGQVVIREGTITPAVKSLIIQLNGAESHAAEPENGINPAYAIKDILQLAGDLNQPDIDQEGFFLITPIHILMGKRAYGVSAGQGELHFTMRSRKQEIMDAKTNEILQQIKTIANHHELDYTLGWTDAFYANINTAVGVNIVKEACQKNNLNLVERKHPLKWGEDFGIISQNFEGAFIGIGAGEECLPLHNDHYDFPDDLIKFGVDLFSGIIDEIL